MNKPLNTEPDPRAPLKIAFVFDDSLDSYDGVAQQVKTIGGWLSSQGHLVRYLVGQTRLKDWAGGRVYSLARNISVSFNANRLSIPLPANRQRIKQILADEDFDVLHVQVPYSPFMAQYVIRNAGVRTAVIGTFHILPAGRLAAGGSRLLPVLYGNSLKRFDYITSVSPPSAAFAKDSFGSVSEVIPNVINVQNFAAAKTNGFKPAPQRIIFLGRLVKRKGCLQLLQAFCLLKKVQPEARLIIAGDGPLRSSLEQYVKKNQLEHSVEFMGFIAEVKKADLLASAAIACFPSLYAESFGVVLLEAMAAGAGVVLGGNNPGYSSVLGEQPSLLIDPRQSQKFAERLEVLLTDKQLANRLHRWQITTVKQYDVGVIGPRLLEIYHRAIVKRSKSGHN